MGSAIFFVVAPVLAAAIIPSWITHWDMRPTFFGIELARLTRHDRWRAFRGDRALALKHFESATLEQLS